MSDWRSYDQIAGRYDQVAGPRFRTVALKMWALLPTPADARVLDIGTGTGVVPLAAAESGRTPNLAMGGDRSHGMLVQARHRAPWLRVLVCDAVALPFHEQSVDIATASFVLSHLREPQRALRELHRVLKRPGAIAVSSWAPASDPFSAAWSDALAEAITRPQSARASWEVIPSEGHFSEAGRLESALDDAGFSDLVSDAVDFTLAPTVEQFVDDRELTAGGRLGLSLLGPGEWARFKARFRTVLENGFGPQLHYSRRAFIAVARKW
jgi:ubiquinone/menaquinone biosynthesis C-methylase UbiE